MRAGERPRGLSPSAADGSPAETPVVPPTPLQRLSPEDDCSAAVFRLAPLYAADRGAAVSFLKYTVSAPHVN